MNDPVEKPGKCVVPWHERWEANDAWVKLYDDCLAETGQGLLLVSGWRDWGESKRLERMTERLKAGEMNFIPWIYTFLTSKHPDIVRTAATTLANYVDSMDPKYLIRFDEQFRSCTSVEWSIDWSRVDISRIASILGKNKTFIWMMRLGTFNPNGYYREKCIRVLKSDPGSYIFLLIRLKA